MCERLVPYHLPGRVGPSLHFGDDLRAPIVGPACGVHAHDASGSAASGPLGAAAAGRRVHYGKGRTQQMVLVRLEQGNDAKE